MERRGIPWRDNPSFQLSSSSPFAFLFDGHFNDDERIEPGHLVEVELVGANVDVKRPGTVLTVVGKMKCRDVAQEVVVHGYVSAPEAEEKR
jgi:hypothetical protein